MGQESSFLIRNPYENYPSKSNHQKLLISAGTEHYINLSKYRKSKINISSSNNSINTSSTYHQTYHSQLSHTSTNKSWNYNTNNTTIVDKIPKHLPPPPPLPCSNLPTEIGSDRYKRIKKTSSRSSFGLFNNYSNFYCSSNSSAFSSASKILQVKKADYLSHHLHIKSYLDILEEDKKAKENFKPRPGIRNYKPKILNCGTTELNTESQNKETETWI